MNRSVNDALRAIGIDPIGGGNSTVRRRIRRMGLDTAHFDNPVSEKYDPTLRQCSRRYTDVEFVEAIRTSVSIRQALEKLGLVAMGGNYKTARDSISRLKLDTAHMTGRNWNRGKKTGERYPIEYYLVIDGPNIAPSWLRQRLINEELKEARCEECDITEWRGRPAPLHLDHINGMRNDNRLENLRILCANCHSLTGTYGKTKEYLAHGPKPKTVTSGTRRRRSDAKSTTRRVRERCACGNKKSCRAKTCLVCYESTRRECKIDWPDIQELVVMLDASSYLEVGRRLGVSDNAIRKRLRARR